jgi:ATP dependent DNA ligase domain
MPRLEFCIPTVGTKVPAGRDWFHEIKYDGYRLRVERDGDRVRLITRGGHDWTKLPMDRRSHAQEMSRAIIGGEAVRWPRRMRLNSLHQPRRSERLRASGKRLPALTHRGAGDVNHASGSRRVVCSPGNDDSRASEDRMSSACRARKMTNGIEGRTARLAAAPGRR